MLSIIDDHPDHDLDVNTVSILDGLIGEKGVQAMAVLYITKFQLDGDPAADLLECRKACRHLLALVESEGNSDDDPACTISSHPHYPYHIETSCGGAEE